MTLKDRHGVVVEVGDFIAFRYKGSGSWGNGAGDQSGFGAIVSISEATFVVRSTHGSPRRWRLRRDQRFTKIEP